MSEYKKCSICKRKKNISKFGIDNRRKGFKPACKSCNRISDREKREHRRDFIWQYKKEHPCVDCGESNPIVLQFDHIKGEKSNDISDMTKHSIKTLKKEIEKCVIRCANCHLIKTAVDFGYYKKQIKNES